MQKKWKKLNNPPVIVAIFQIKINLPEDFIFNEFISNDKEIRTKFPDRNDNYHSNIGVQGTPAPGISFVKAKADTHIESYAYTTKDLTKKFFIEQGSIRYAFEGGYKEWELFKVECMQCLKLIEVQLQRCKVVRTSIRFINKFKFDSFNDPLDYFTTTISIDSDSKLNNPVTGFAYRFNQQIPNSSIRTVINHALEKIEDKFDYYFDIDVLDNNSFDFNIEHLDLLMEEMRDIKNTLFFETLKDKTINLCN